MRALLLCLLAMASPAAAGLVSSPLSSALRVDDKLDVAQAAFLRAAASPDPKVRQAALDALVAIGQPAVLAPLVTEYARVSEELRSGQQRERDQATSVEQREALLDAKRQRVAREPDLARSVERDAEALEKLKKELARTRSRIADDAPWKLAVRDGVVKLLGELQPEKRKKAETELSQDAQSHPEPNVRLASIDLLGDAGGPGSAVLLQRIVAERSAEGAKLELGLAKAMADVRKMEKRLQEEAATQNEQFSRATMDQYNAVKEEAAAARKKCTALVTEADLAADAGGRALARASGKDLENDLAALMRALKKAKDRGYARSVALLAKAPLDPVRAALRTALTAETEPLARAELIGALAEQRDAEAVPFLIEKCLVDPAWIVRSRAVDALATMRSREAIPALIARIEAEQGRLRTDVGRALVSLTAKDFHDNAELWRRWWRDNEAGFTVPPMAEKKSALEEAREQAGVTFFGITTESQHVLFVLDCSRSMEFSLVGKSNPDDDPDKPFDYPGGDEPSRMAAAKRDLLKALGGLKDGGTFNLVLYAADVWTWDDQLVAMNADTRAEVYEYIAKLETGPGTNIYGALERAFEIAGAKPGGAWSKPAIDTIFFLSDGRPTIGVTNDREEILAMVREKNANAGIVIHTIGLSGAQDAQLLRRLAEENGGSYVAR
jgi:HEAT repeat protein